MMNKIIRLIISYIYSTFKLTLLYITVYPFIFSQTSNYYLDHIARVSFPNIIYSETDTAGGSDVWGYTDKNGDDYAIMGVLNGTAIIRVKDLQLISTISGPDQGDPYFHRDMMTFNNYLYICHEMTGTNEGIQIIDLSPLPDSIKYVKNYSRKDMLGQDANTSHNLFVDSNTSTLLTVRKYYNGVRIISLKDPENPEEIGLIETPDIHDMYSNNDTIFIAEGWNGSFSIWDAKINKIEPELISRVYVPSSGYVHSVWLTDNKKYLMTAEETSNKTIKIWDIRNLNNIELIGNYLGLSRLAHNIHIKDNLAYISHYSSGISIVDISNPYSPIEVATYDTYSRNNSSNFFGAWGIYPYSSNNYIYASNIEGHLDILKLKKKPSELTNKNELYIKKFSLSQNFPNPFNQKTKIPLLINSSEEISLSIYNSFGEKVKILIDGHLNKGNYLFSWDGSSYSSGIYFLRLESRDIVLTKKMLLIK